MAKFVIDVAICLRVAVQTSRCEHVSSSLRLLVRSLHCAALWTVISTTISTVNIALAFSVIGYPSYGIFLAIIGYYRLHSIFTPTSAFFRDQDVISQASSSCSQGIVLRVCLPTSTEGRSGAVLASFLCIVGERTQPLSPTRRR
jgi:hypothetical protein